MGPTSPRPMAVRILSKTFSAWASARTTCPQRRLSRPADPISRTAASKAYASPMIPVAPLYGPRASSMNVPATTWSACSTWRVSFAVSYTHLTLPTILRV